MEKETKKRYKKPLFLTQKAKPFYDLLMKNLSEVKGFIDLDTHILGMLAIALSDYSEALKTLEQEGMYYNTPEMIRIHPAYRIMKESEKTIKELGIQFGLSPKARERLMKFRPNAESDLLDDLDRL